MADSARWKTEREREGGKGTGVKKWGRRSDAIKKGKEGRKEVRISRGSIFTQGRRGREGGERDQT